MLHIQMQKRAYLAVPGRQILFVCINVEIAVGIVPKHFERQLHICV